MLFALQLCSRNVTIKTKRQFSRPTPLFHQHFVNLPSLFAAADAPEEEGEDDEEEKEEVADASLPISQPSSKELYKELITSSSSEHPLAVKS